VHLIDPVPRLVAEAETRNRTCARKLKSCAIGDARSLNWAANSVDVVLELGPLYHLIEREHRLQALREAQRVLTPGGRFFAAAISWFASALDGLRKDLFVDDTFRAIVKQDLIDGIHRNNTGQLEYFTTAKFHRPDELEFELIDAGFIDVEVFGIEGPGWLFPDFGDRWAEPRRREDLLAVARALEREPSVQGISAHLLAVGRKIR
jgi:SAM-dependent methyltransferase